MKLNSKGQVTIPAQLRAEMNLHEGDEVDVVQDGNALRIVRTEGAKTHGQRVVERMSGTANTGMGTDELMKLLRGED